MGTDLRVVAEQAGMVATAWSPPDAPPSWRLTAAQFEALRNDQEMLELGATIPEERLPPLLFEAAATFLVLALEPRPLRDWFPRVGEPQPPLESRRGHTRPLKSLPRMRAGGMGARIINGRSARQNDS